MAGVTQRGVQTLSSLVTLPVALHALGLAQFGLWGAATSLLSLGGMITLGLGSALISLLPFSQQAGESARSRAYVEAALLSSVMLCALLLAGMGLALGLTGLGRVDPVFLIAAFGLILNIPLCIGPDLWFALQKGYVASFWGVGQTLLSLTGLLAGVALGARTGVLVGLFYLALLLANGGALAHVLWRHPPLRPRAWPDRAAWRAVLSRGGLLSGVTIAGASLTVFDNILVLVWLGPLPAALMAVAMRVCVTASGFLEALAQPFWPGFAQALAAGERGWVRRALWRGLAASLALGLLGGLVLVAVGAPVLNWWLRADLGLSRLLLGCMALWIFAVTASYVPAALLRARGALWPQILVLGSGALAGLGLKYLAAPALGVAGVLLSVALVGLVWVLPWFIWLGAGPSRGEHDA